MLLLIFLSLACVNGQQKSYDGWTLVRANPSTDDQVAYLSNLRDNLAGFELQVWQSGGLTRPYEIFVSPETKAEFLAKLDDLKIPFEIKSDNIQQALNAEQVPTPPRARALAGVGNSAWFSKFLKLDEINSAIQQLAKNYPNQVSIQSIGTTYRGKPINLVKISTGTNSANKPGILIDGGIHAREWAAPATVLYILNKLLTGYSTNPAIQNYLNSATFYIIPVLNPDGYEYTHTKDRMWRKNRRPGTGSCSGVDLNRNFDYGFGGAGTSDDPCDETYRGPSAFSEPESRAFRDFLLSHKDIKAYITIHSYSQMWFYPFGDKVKSYPADVNDLAAVANLGAQKLESLYGTHYDVGTAADLLYEAAGGSDDWSKGKGGIKYVYCLEVRPDGNAAGNGFILPPSQIIPTGEETFAGLSAVFDAVCNTSSN